MKTFVTILSLIILSTYSCKAQRVVDVSNAQNWLSGTSLSSYLKDTQNRFDEVIGTWKWEQGNSSFEIEFIKITKHQLNNKLSTDLALGRYKYIENGVTVVDLLNTPINPDDFWADLIYMNENEYHLILEDTISQKTEEGTFILSNNDTTATFVLKNTRGMKLSATNLDFSLPTELILTKQ